MQAPPPQTPRLAVLILLSALAALPVNLFVPSLPHIARDLDADFATVNIAVAGYAVATALVHLLAGSLSDRYGRRPVLLAGLLIFTVASVGCSLATDIGSFLAWRLLQAPVMAAYAVSLAVIRDTSAAQAARRIGTVSSAWAVAPMLGPAVGGLLDSSWGWRASFVLFALLGLAAFGLALRRLPETHHRRQASLAHSIKAYGELLRSPRLHAYGLCMALSLGTLYVFLGGAPLLAAPLGGLSALQLGIYMGLVPAGFIIGSAVIGRWGARAPALRFIVIGRTLTCLGLLLAAALMVAGASHPLAFFGPCVCVGLGNGLTLPVANARVLGLHPGLAGSAAGLVSAITVIGAGGLAFVAGLAISADNARLAVPAAMLTTALLSLLAAALVARQDQTGADESGPG